MDREAFITDQLPALRRLLERAYDQGAADKTAEMEGMRRAALLALGAPPPEHPTAPPRRKVARVVGARVRAPKGSVGATVDLAFVPGMTTREVQDAVNAIAPNINLKSVYNELRLQTRKYRKADDGRWYGAADNAIPPADHSNVRPNGSAGGHEALHITGSSARAPEAPGEVGGT